MGWKQLLASITGSIDEELRLRNAYLALDKFFDYTTSIMASAIELPLCEAKAPQHWREEAFEGSGFYPEWPIRQIAPQYETIYTHLAASN